MALAAMLAATGCSGLVQRAGGSLAEGVAEAAMRHDDPELVAAALPGYLILADAAVQAAPRDGDALVRAARLYAAYAGALVRDPARRRRLSERALGYARRAACLRSGTGCTLRGEGLRAVLAGATAEDVEPLYALATAWLVWIEARREDWGARAELAEAELVLRRVAALAPDHDDGGVQLQLGVLSALVPPALGGDPEAARRHFERALRLSGGKRLMVKVLMAEHLARAVGDRRLHDRLLREVLAADPEAGRHTLENVLARRRARALLEEADRVFGDGG
ncbi:TRAP transporter TatT component family protein [Inmirania thermothiophila]|uniref:TRAP transporter TatT component family protein n=1 Tax=Inmirania thermothiophila TaxID=1750597 RepID=A0A3N1Y0U7_9GAMM|nr:TRAP transporter TatT component family protein [Inmirania thermothiophila]